MQTIEESVKQTLEGYKQAIDKLCLSLLEDKVSSIELPDVKFLANRFSNVDWLEIYSEMPTEGTCELLVGLYDRSNLAVEIHEREGEYFLTINDSNDVYLGLFSDFRIEHASFYDNEEVTNGRVIIFALYHGNLEIHIGLFIPNGE